MSLAAWKKKYYPVEANKVPKSKALAHSLQKWQGLLPSVLNRYGLCLQADILVEKNMVGGNSLEINDSSCSLCQHFIGRRCAKCPLRKSLGQPCDFGDGAPYWAFFDNSDAKPMLAVLRKAAEKKGMK